MINNTIWDLLTDEELIVFLKVSAKQELTNVETETALTAIKRECPMFFYDQVVSGEFNVL
ncbi:hypothetical protein LCGC14_1001540 [marine sediment metagenome]|uniref:Uncharacterized protein n=1 Tax=marine sediment metagenome TaxID=412755 RepID=A0A0F9NPD7_9ZZZZ